MTKLTKIIIILNIFLLLLQVVVANRLTTAGLSLTNLEKQEKNLREENESTERKIATSSSLVQVSQKAAEVGFIKPSLFYLTPAYPVALENLNVAAK